MMQLMLNIAGLDLSGLEGLIVILFILGIILVVIEMITPIGTQEYWESFH